MYFKNGKTDWQIGQILQFAKLFCKLKGKAVQGYITVEENLGKVGVLLFMVFKN